MGNTGRTAAPRVLRLVAAGGPDALDGEIRFHPRLTVLADERRSLAEWVVSLLGVQAPPDTLLEIDNVPARTYDLPRALRALPPAEPLRVDMLCELALGRAARERSNGRARSLEQIADELERWEHVLAEAKIRLANAHDAAPRVDPVDLAQAARLRNEWRYSEHVDAWERRRRSRRDADAHRGRYDEFLATFGASSYEDLSMVGTGFGDTTFDVAIREAATVVSMAEQRCHKLRMELETARQPTASDDESGAGPPSANTHVDLSTLDAEYADRLIARALAELDDTAYVRPLVVDRVLDALAPDARQRAYERLLAHARRRQIVLVTGSHDIARWAALGAPGEVALRLDLAGVTRAD